MDPTIYSIGPYGQESWNAPVSMDYSLVQRNLIEKSWHPACGPLDSRLLYQPAKTDQFTLTAEQQISLSPSSTNIPKSISLPTDLGLEPNIPGQAPTLLQQPYPGYQHFTWIQQNPEELYHSGEIRSTKSTKQATRRQSYRVKPYDRSTNFQEECYNRLKNLNPPSVHPAYCNTYPSQAPNFKLPRSPTARAAIMLYPYPPLPPHCLPELRHAHHRTLFMEYVKSESSPLKIQLAHFIIEHCTRSIPEDLFRFDASPPNPQIIGDYVQQILYSVELFKEQSRYQYGKDSIPLDINEVYIAKWLQEKQHLLKPLQILNHRRQQQEQNGSSENLNFTKQRHSKNRRKIGVSLGEELDALGIPRAIHYENLTHAIANCGLVVQLPSHCDNASKNIAKGHHLSNAYSRVNPTKRSLFNLLIAGRGDTRRSRLEMPWGEVVRIKYNRTLLGIPDFVVEAAGLGCQSEGRGPHQLIPKVCAVSLEDSPYGVEILLFYRGMPYNKKLIHRLQAVNKTQRPQASSVISSPIYIDPNSTNYTSQAVSAPSIQPQEVRIEQDQLCNIPNSMPDLPSPQYYVPTDSLDKNCFSADIGAAPVMLQNNMLSELSQANKMSLNRSYDQVYNEQHVTASVHLDPNFATLEKPIPLAILNPLISEKNENLSDNSNSKTDYDSLWKHRKLEDESCSEEIPVLYPYNDPTPHIPFKSWDTTNASSTCAEETRNCNNVDDVDDDLNSSVYGSPIELSTVEPNLLTSLSSQYSSTQGDSDCLKQYQGASSINDKLGPDYTEEPADQDAAILLMTSLLLENPNHITKNRDPNFARAKVCFPDSEESNDRGHTTPSNQCTSPLIQIQY